MSELIGETDEKVEAAARCLAHLDGRFISAADWEGEVGNEYRRRGRRVVQTLILFDAGYRSGGLP